MLKKRNKITLIVDKNQVGILDSTDLENIVAGRTPSGAITGEIHGSSAGGWGGSIGISVGIG
jgi:hypothetical protein